MNSRLTIFFLVSLMIVLAAPTGVSFAEVTSGSDKGYTVPEDLKPVWTWKKGYSLDDAIDFRKLNGGKALLEPRDYGVYANKHLGEFLLTAKIYREGPVSVLESKLMPEISNVVATTALGTMTLREMLDDPRSRMEAIAVVHKGKIVFEEYPGMRPWENHFWASMTKALPGIMIHILEEEGLIDLNAPISDYIPELKGTAWSKVPVKDSLHQRAGLNIQESNLDEPGHPTNRFYATFAGVGEDKSFISVMKRAKKEREPGQLFEYSSMNTYIQVLIAEKVTGKPFNDLVTDYIWRQAGMEGDALLGISESGESLGFGIYSSRLMDLARFGMLFTPSWNVVAKKRVVSKSYLPKVYAASKPDTFRGADLGKRMIRDFGDIEMGVSYQWDVVFPDGDIYKSGRAGQCLYISPETDTVVVYFSYAYPIEYQKMLWVHAYAREIVKQVFRKK